MQSFQGPFRDCFTISSTRNSVHPTRIDQIYKKNTLPDPTYQEKRLKTANSAPQFGTPIRQRIKESRRNGQVKVLQDVLPPA